SSHAGFSMRISNALFASFVALCLALPLAACGSSSPADNDPFDTLQACYDDHHSGTDHLPVQQAIATCCLDHPIGGMAAPTCLTTQADCEAHVHTALPSIAASDITAACMIYISQK
ncbi:MAG TPA: hypothetical protein VF516_16300, partial [Kofleriaceae bacterium]